MAPVTPPKSDHRAFAPLPEPKNLTPTAKLQIFWRKPESDAICAIWDIRGRYAADSTDDEDNTDGMHALWRRAGEIAAVNPREGES